MRYLSHVDKYLTLKYKYKYKYKYSGHKYKYKYKYFKMVLEYYSSTSTSTKYYISVVYGPPTTGRIWQLAYGTNHKQGATKLLKLLSKYLLMVTFENGEKYPMQTFQ